jgi:trans-2-enoyl-CoA reductase
MKGHVEKLVVAQIGKELSIVYETQKSECLHETCIRQVKSRIKRALYSSTRARACDVNGDVTT